MKLYMALWGGGHPFDHLPFTDEQIVDRPDQLKEEGVLVIWGGGDISPTIYNKRVSTRTHADAKLSGRDVSEVNLAKRAIELGIPIIGVCRGAQLLCALAGGHLIQHVNSHGGRHLVKTMDGKEFFTNSIHHQMMYPFDVEHELRAWVPNNLSTIHVDIDDEGNEFNRDVKCEPEYVYFPKVKGYAIQWHPEGMDHKTDANQWLLEDIRKGIFENACTI